MNIHSSARTSVRGRELLVQRVRLDGWSVPEAAEASGVSPRTVYKWLRRFDEEGPAGLGDRSSRPQRSPTSVPRNWQELVLQLRRSRMTGAQIAKRLKLPRSTVARVLKRHGLERLKFLDPPEPVRRYEKKHPGELIHLDVKKLGRFRGVGHRITGHHANLHRSLGAGWEFVHVCIDDYSRLAYVEILDDEKGPTTVGFLKRALAWFAEHGVKVQRVMTDNGTNYRSHVFRDALVRLQARPLPDQALHPSHQRKGRALHPDHAPGMGVRQALPDLRPAPGCPCSLAPKVQSAAPPRRNRRRCTHHSASGGRVNNLLGMHS